MNKDFKELIQIFKIINNRGYIKGINNNIFNSAGLTFENLLDKKPDTIYFPDFKNIEIKTTQRFSHYPITLFCSNFDGPSLYESNYLLETYGNLDSKIQNKKHLVANLYINEKIQINDNYLFELSIDHIKQRLLINIYDKENNFIESRAYIDFTTLETKFNLKLRNLALIYASKKKINNDLYFRYYKIRCFNCNDFNTFLKLIEEKIIKTTLMLRVGKSGISTGKNKSKNIVFAIDKKKISYLFNEIYYFEN